MATNSWSTPIDCSSDAGLRTWGGELSSAFTTAGFPMTADTGQINWATATRGSTNSSSGYEIRYLNDSLHATAPIYVKIEYGVGSSSATPAMWITTGTGTNGSGTLTGITTPRQTMFSNSVPTSTVTNYQSRLCVLPGYIGLMYKIGASSSGGVAAFILCRFTDTSGTISDSGWSLYYCTTGSGLNRSSVIRSSGLVSSDYNNYAFVPGSQSDSSLILGQPQVFRHFVRTPTVAVLPQVLTFLYSEIGDQTTFTATPVGITSRTYMAFANNSQSASIVNSCGASGHSTNKIAMQWE